MGSKSSKINVYLADERCRNDLVSSPNPPPYYKSKSAEENHQLNYDYNSNLLRIRSRSLDIAKVNPFKESVRRSISDEPTVKSPIQCSSKLPWLLSKLNKHNDVSILDFKFGKVIGKSCNKA